MAEKEVKLSDLMNIKSKPKARKLAKDYKSAKAACGK
jgi:hypothetical protein